MQCREFEDRLNLLLDERRPPGGDPLLAEHAQSCETCGQLLAGHEALLMGVSHWKRHRAPRPAGDFSRRVVADVVAADLVAAEVVRPSRQAWLVAACLVATAAAVLLAVSIAAWNSLGDGRVAESAPAVAKAPDGSLAAGEAARSRAGGAGARPAALSLFAAPPGGYRAAIADVASTLPDAVERLDQVERYAPGIRPIRISFTMLLEALWRTLPGRSADESQGTDHRSG